MAFSTFQQILEFTIQSTKTTAKIAGRCNMAFEEGQMAVEAAEAKKKLCKENELTVWVRYHDENQFAIEKTNIK